MPYTCFGWRVGLFYTSPSCLQRFLLPLTVSHCFLLVMALTILVSAGQESYRLSTAGILGSFVDVDEELDDQCFGISARLQTATTTHHSGC